MAYGKRYKTYTPARTGKQAAVKAAVAASKAARAATMAARRTGVVPGYTRRSGFYGRYKGERPEKKFFDTTVSFQVDTTAEVPATGQLNLIVQGDTESTRDGRVCHVKSIHFRGLAQFAPGAAATASTVGYMYCILTSSAMERQQQSQTSLRRRTWRWQCEISQIRRDLSF